MVAALAPFAMLLARRGDAASGGGCAPVGCFLVLIGLGLVLFLVFRGRNQRRVDGASARPMPTGPVQPHTFACPFPKCGNCGASADKQKQQWDGLRTVTWSCGYCGHSQVQQLTDDQLPPSARQRLGLDGGMQNGAYPPGYQGGNGMGGGLGSGLGGVMTGMMLGSMLGGNHHNHGGGDGWNSGSGGGSSDNWDSNGDSGSDSGGGWDSGGGDWGGGDSGGDSGGDW